MTNQRGGAFLQPRRMAQIRAEVAFSCHRSRHKPPFCEETSKLLGFSQPSAHNRSSLIEIGDTKMRESFPTGPLCTRKSLADQFRELGVNHGDTLLLHSSLRSLGWVNGGAEAVILALLDVLGNTGMLMVPTQSSDNSDPANWQHPPVPEAWKPIIRETMLP